MSSVFSQESEGIHGGGPAASLMSAWHPACAPAEPAAGRARGVSTPASGFGSRVGHLVAQRLARMVHAGILESGDLLPSERDLSQAFSVARQTIRSALATLESGLMIALSHGRRARVLGPGRLQPPDYGEVLKKVAQRSVHELFEARLAVETQVAAVSAALISPAALERLQSLAEQRRASADDSVAVSIIDFEFHACLHQAARNELLAGLALDFYCCTAPRRGQVGTGGPAGHESLLAALRSRDPIAASHAMREHVLGQARRFADLPAALRAESPSAPAAPAVGSGKPVSAATPFWPGSTRAPHPPSSAA